jgi:uncharacterized protein YjlB
MGDALEILQYRLLDDGVFPNNASLPLLLYPQAVTAANVGDPAAQLELLFHQHAWVNSWRNGVYAYHHYHSTAHEVLGVYCGCAVVQFGGENAMPLTVQAGDVVVIPAGVAHKRLSASPDFGVVGAYPAGQRWDMNYGEPAERPQADQNIARVLMPLFDPVYTAGGLKEIWTQAG